MKLILILGLSSIISLNIFGQISESKLDSLVEATRQTFDVPGIAVGIVKDGKIIHAKGYGLRSLNTKQPVDTGTLFGIASNSKGFTAIALGMLVDRGRLQWDDKVRKFIPEFQMPDSYVSEEFTVRDLLTHRSGLGLGAGDLMFFPEGGNISIEDIINNMRYQKTVSSFRTKFDYNNNFYIIAGEVIKRISGRPWAEFIEDSIMKPLGFNQSRGSYLRVKNNSNLIDAHAPVNGKAVAIPHDWNETANAAGGIMSNVSDLSKWLRILMDSTKYGNGQRLLKPATLREIWSMQTPLPVSSPGFYNTHFYGYGLGYFLSDVKGYLQVQHTGGLIGTVTQLTMLPELKLGIIVLTNQQSGAAFNTITNTIKDSYLGYPDRGWLQRYSANVKKQFAEADRITDSIYKQVAVAQKNNSICLKPEQITGTYDVNWLGDINIYKDGTKTKIKFARSPRLSGELLPLNANTYVAKWDDRSYDADAYVVFKLDKTGKAEELTMEAISPMTDFSFDFHDIFGKRK